MPVDAYGVGASAHDGRWDFTADVVQLDGRRRRRRGASYRTNAKLERVK